jgi:hypothetical protein
MLASSSFSRHVACVTVVCLCFAPVAFADLCGFSEAEGYSEGALHGQPGAGSVWDCTNTTNTYFNVRHSDTGFYGEPDYLYLRTSITDGSPEKPYNYATKRLVPVSGDFTAGFSILIPYGSTGTSNTTQIALGEHCGSGWGPTLAFNMLTEKSLAFYDGTDWENITTALAQNAWYDIAVAGNTVAGCYSVEVVKRADGSPVVSRAGLSFSEAVGELAYVRVCNEGSSHLGSGSYYHAYDNLTLVPEPAAMSLLLLGGVAMLRRRR